MKKRKTFKVSVLGCRTNQYEAQAFEDQLIAMGYERASEEEEADVCIINTCTVTESADSSSRHAIRQLIKQNPQARVAVTGCYAERNAEAVKKISGVDHVVLNQNKEKLVEVLFPEEEYPEFSIRRFSDHTRAFVKVQDGCNSFCTYCIIPYVRGRSRSRTLPEILKEVEELVHNGHQEIVLTGINIGDFDGGVGKGEPPVSLAQLVRAVDRVDGVKRVRVSSIDPDEVDDDLLDAIVNGRHTCHSMHIVLQSGSNVVLKRMNRKYTRQMFIDTVDKLKKASPKFTFTTDIIVGFPGETETDHQDTLAMMEEVRFAKVHMFPYSDRPRTRANLYPNKVPSEVIRKRKQEILRLSERHAYLLREQFLGETMEVLTEQRDKNNPEWITGYTDNFLEVKIRSTAMQTNQRAWVKLIENHADGCVAELVGDISTACASA
ncbi:MAG: tRNA (N(6)-L-threonylcarbamoyladenosine(37)-C(2))-methylthiotransferase MtaB [Chlamydiales bacterium]